MADAKGSKDKDGKRPIIKKVKKVSGGGHHGGAWKVAYADFVTAMMAFFLLLWLLSTSSKATLEGIAEFFTPTIGITGSQGIGFKGGIAAIKGVSKEDTSDPSIVVGQNPSGPISQALENVSPVESEQEDNLFKQGADSVQQMMTQDKSMQEFADNISVQLTPEGLKIDLMDSDKHPMFEQASANLTPDGQKILTRMNGIIKRMPNYVSITGHTDASPTEAGRADYGNWELSADRANATRRFLLKVGMEAERPKRVVGMGDKELLLPSEPRSPRNRRISIVMMRGSHILLPDSLKAPPQDLLQAPAVPVH